MSNIRCVIFDKDGTIVCFHSMWTPWALKVATDISIAVGKDLKQDILNCLGVDLQTFRTNQGLLAECTKGQIAERLTQLVVERGIEMEQASMVVQKLTLGCDIDKDKLRFLADLPSLFSGLRDRGIKIAVCTSDDRTETIAALERGQVLHLVDVMACGDDPHGYTKPSAACARYICNQLNVTEQQTIMVGDTKTDIMLGVNAQLAASVGVLTGIGTVEMLKEAGATHVVNSVEDILQIFFTE